MNLAKILRFSTLFIGLWALVERARSEGGSIEAPVSLQGISITEGEPAKYPRNLIQAGIHNGWAKVKVAIGDDGTLLDALVIGYTHPEFEHATLEALKKWSFSPAKVNGKPVTSVIQINFNYDHSSNGPKVVHLDPLAIRLQQDQLYPGEANRLISFEELDRIPIPIHVVPPKFTDDEIHRLSGKRVGLNFYIDEQGRVRLPTLAYTDDEGIALKAVEAVKHWRFEAPMHHRKPVITLTNQEFVVPEKR